MFLLPDGSPMDAAEVADMMNSWMGNKPTEPKLPMSVATSNKFKIKRYEKYPYIVKNSIGVPPDDYRYYHHYRPQYTETTYIEIPIYDVDFINELDKLSVKAMRQGVTISGFSVGYDIFYNLKGMLKDRSYMYFDEKHSAKNKLVIGISGGTFNIYCNGIYQDISPLYENFSDYIRNKD